MPIGETRCDKCGGSISTPYECKHCRGELCFDCFKNHQCRAEKGDKVLNDFERAVGRTHRQGQDQPMPTKGAYHVKLDRDSPLVDKEPERIRAIAEILAEREWYRAGADEADEPCVGDFSDLAVCLGRKVSNAECGLFTEMWNAHIKLYRDAATATVERVTGCKMPEGTD